MRVHLEDNAWHGYGSETLWVERVSEGKYRLRNSPFFARGLSFGDIVHSKSDSGEQVFLEKLIESGRSTYWLLLFDEAPRNEISEQIQNLEGLGCKWESAELGYTLYSIDVPAEADIEKVYACIEEGQRKGLWDFEEASFAHRSQVSDIGK